MMRPISYFGRWGTTTPRRTKRGSAPRFTKSCLIKSWRTSRIRKTTYAMPRSAQTYEALASLDRRLGDGGRAEAMDALRVELWQGWERKLPKNPFVLRQIAAKRAD